MTDAQVLLQTLQKIRARIAESEIEEALDDLIAVGTQTRLGIDDEVLALRQQFRHIQKQIDLNLIPYSEYAQALNNISYAVLRLITTTCRQLQQKHLSANPTAGISLPALEKEASISLKTEELSPILREGQQKMEAGDYTGALQQFSAYLQVEPRSWHAMHYLGQLHEILGLWDEAIHWYSEALKINPANALALNNRGNIRMEQMEDFARAYKDFSAALVADPSLFTAHYNRAVAAANLQNYEQAVADLNACIGHHLIPDTAFGLRGICLVALERYQEAMKDLSIAIQREPDNAVYWSNYGLCEYHSGSYPQAIHTLTHALSLNPNQPDIQHIRGMAYFFSEDYSAAQRDFQQLVQQKSNHAYGWYFLGLCHKMTGNPTEAIHCLGEAIRHNPEFADAYAVLGVIAYENGQTNEAIRLFQQTLELRADHPVARQYLQKAQQRQSSTGFWKKLFGGA
ncbi:MAG: tetratricopeptide repeat protein [Saprospiraceae bacterium]|nr:tetratricopeptide repeat protein [Saprospiraceae bacterium]MDW8485030.1 tetratricopeptide repeat protein [Saprospiraceae bacterium]